MIINIFQCGGVTLEPATDNLGRITVRQNQRRCMRCGEDELVSEQHEQAKLLTEYFRGLRPFPFSDHERQIMINDAYRAGRRLYPYCEYAHATVIEIHREQFRQTLERISELALQYGLLVSPDRPNLVGEFDEMLRRQADIILTGRAVTEADRYYHTSRIRERHESLQNEIRTLLISPVISPSPDSHLVMPVISLPEPESPGSDSEPIHASFLSEPSSSAPAPAPTSSSPQDGIETYRYSRRLLKFGRWVTLHSQQLGRRLIQSRDFDRDMADYLNYLGSELPTDAPETRQTRKAFHALTVAGFMYYGNIPFIDTEEGTLDSRPLSLPIWCSENEGFQYGEGVILPIYFGVVQRYYQYLNSNPDWEWYRILFRKDLYRSIVLSRQILEDIPFNRPLREGYEARKQHFDDLVSRGEFHTTVALNSNQALIDFYENIVNIFELSEGEAEAAPAFAANMSSAGEGNTDSYGEGESTDEESAGEGSTDSYEEEEEGVGEGSIGSYEEEGDSDEDPDEMSNATGPLPYRPLRVMLRNLRSTVRPRTTLRGRRIPFVRWDLYSQHQEFRTMYAVASALASAHASSNFVNFRARGDT